MLRRSRLPMSSSAVDRLPLVDSLNGTSAAWLGCGASVRGASHERSGLPNQDAERVYLGDTLVGPAIACVSDGHGSAKCFRSDVGSTFAVEVGVEVTARFLREYAAESSTQLKRAAESYLPYDLSSEWRRRVQAHLQANPFTAEERSLLGLGSVSPAESDAAAHIGAKGLVAYGATLLIAAVVGESVIYLQLGDGAILTVARGGVVDSPIADDPELIANETTSLCMPKAPTLFRCRFQPRNADGPVLIVVCTDGYSNAFASTEGFRQAGPDLLRFLERDGIGPLSASLPGWLQAASHEGSGDDVSLGLLWLPMPQVT